MRYYTFISRIISEPPIPVQVLFKEDGDQTKDKVISNALSLLLHSSIIFKPPKRQIKSDSMNHDLTDKGFLIPFLGPITFISLSVAADCLLPPSLEEGAAGLV